MYATAAQCFHRVTENVASLLELDRMITIREIRAAGKTHLRINCEGCRSVSAVPWELMPAIPADACLEDVAARLRCSACGHRPGAENVTPWAQYEASGFQVAFRA